MRLFGVVDARTQVQWTKHVVLVLIVIVDMIFVTVDIAGLS
jgi:hypothetical protein